MLKYGQVNPLNVWGLRRVNHCPPHFERVEFTLNTTEKKLLDWIYENLEGRFYFFSDATYPRQCIVGFEIVGEASYFLLMLDQFNDSLNILGF